MIGFLLATSSSASACGFTQLNISNWLGINSLVILAIITIAAFVYTLANLLPGERGQKLKGAANYEIIEAMLSIVLIIVLLLLVSAECSVGPALVGSNGYTGVFGADDTYLGNLLFLNGLNIVSNFYTTSIQFVTVANIWYFGSTQVADLLGTKTFSPKGVQMKMSVSSSIDILFTEFSELFTAIYSGLLIVTFGGLFILFLTLPIVQAGAFNVVIPIAIVMRAIPFAGPQLRRTANTFIALAIGFFLVFPLTIAFDSYVASCLSMPFGGGAAQCNASVNYPFFSNALSGYDGAVTAITSNSVSIFTVGSSTAQSGQVPSDLNGLSLPTTFFGTSFANYGQFFTELYDAPLVAEQYGRAIADYVFLGVFLLAIDMAITMGFVISVAKGLNNINQVFGSGPVLE